MKRVKQLIVILSLMPFLTVAQSTEYVTDNKTKTVVPASNTAQQQAPIIQEKPLPVAQQATPQVSAKSVDIVVPVPIEVTSKSVPVEVEEDGVPIMRFEKKKINFGKLKMGATPTYIYTFTNIGTEPIVIDIVSACDCTVVEYTQTAIPAGEKGFIKATFHSDRTPEYINKELEKEITIILKNKYPENGYPMVETVFFKAFLEE
jgi:hypothetical protein